MLVCSPSFLIREFFLQAVRAEQTFAGAGERLLQRPTAFPRPRPTRSSSPVAQAWHGGGETTYFSFSISMESRFMSVSLKSKDRLSPMRLKPDRSGGSGAGIGFIGYNGEICN